ncbi:Ninein [Dissostichus eleginoides]|uniref:Ninein n=1 Tax=Dissostichus eleginoides TaxID=100907 RepID=A0AAD9C6I8_DISEL|nr:Ninein [Dissostichus eleginoides]
MDEVQEQDEYEERLKEVFHSFDASSCGSLNPEELSDLCCSLQLEEAVLHSLLQRPQQHTDRVDFDQFKNALILALSSTFEPAPSEQETLSKPDSPEIQPKFVKGSKRYGRRTTPEFIEHHSDFPDVMNADAAQHEDLRDSDDSAVPRKRERWNAHDTSTEEFEAEGQMQLWNPDDPITLRGSGVPPLPPAVQERLQDACHQLQVSWDGSADHSQLMELCQHLGLEINVDVLQSLTGDGEMNVQEFVSRVLNQNKPPTPSASTPYRQLKRLHSTQPFDEGGRRTASCPLSSSIGLRLFSSLDDGSGFTAVESLLDAWMEEGVENSLEILQNGIHQAALASFRSEIRHLLERVDRELGEKGRIRSDLEKTDKLKAQLAVEVDERHAAIEQTNNQNLRKLEQDHREKLSVVRSDLMKDMELMQQQNDQKRETLEAELEKIREDESFLRDHLSISLQENRRLEMELLDSTDHLVAAQSQNTKLQTNLENMRKEKFGDLDPGSADFLLQEERIKELRSSYEAHFRELQDRIDELQMELQEFHSVGRVLQPGHKTLSEELESKSPGMESDPGIGADEVQPFSMSLEAEMMLEHLKEQHLQEIEELQSQLECKMNEFDEMLVKKKEAQEEQTASLALQHQQEVEALREEMLGVQKKTRELQIRLEEEISTLQRRLNEEKEEMDVLQEEQLTALRQQLQEVHSYAADLEEQINTNMDEDAVEELRKQHEEEIKKLQEEQVELSDVRLEEERRKQHEEKEEEERRLLKDFENEKELLQERHTEELKVRLEKAKVRFEEEQVELSEAKLEEATRRLQEEFEKEKEALQERHKEEVKVRLEEVKVKFEEEKVQLEEQSNESLQVVLEEEVLRLVREQQEKEAELRMHWKEETVRLQQLHQEAQLQERLTLQELHQEALLQERLMLQELHQEALLQERLTLQELHQKALLQERLTLQERSEQREARVREELEKERLQLEEDYEGMLQERMEEEREKLETQREEEERRVEGLMEEERSRLQEKHQEELEEQRSRLQEKHQEVMEEERSRLQEKQQEVMEEERSRLQEKQQEVMEEERSRLQEKHQEVMEEERSRLQEKQQEVMEEEMSRLQEKQQEVMEEERSRLQEKQQQLMKEVMLRHAAEREALSGEMEALREDIAQERRDIEMSFNRRLQEVQSRFSGDQESVAERFQMDVLKLEQSYQEELKSLSDKQQEQELCWEEKIQEDVEELGVKNEQLQKELDDLISDAQTKELALSKQLNDLHTRLQGSLETKDELFALAEQKALDSEFLLNQTVQDFKHEREELLNIQTELEVKRNETLSMSERHIEERIELLTERGDLRVKIEELEALLKQAAEDFELERKELQENLGETGDMHAERDALDAVVGGSENVDEKSDNEVESMPEVNQVAASEDYRKEDLNSEKVGCCSAEIGQEDPELTSSESPDTPHNSDVESEEEAVPREMSCEQVSSLEAFGGEDGEKVEALASCEEENKPQDVSEILSHEEEELNHETEVDPAEPEETDELQDAVVHYLPDKSESDWEHLTTEPPDDCAHDSDADCAEVKDRSLLKLRALYSTVTEENTLLQDKVYLLQQKTELLENLLLYNAEKVKNGHQVLEENYGLKVKVLLLMEHVKALEMKAFKMTLLQIKYDDCMCENGKLKEQNAELEKRVWSRLESGRDFQEKESLSQFFCEFEKQQQEEGSSDDDLQDSCEEFEMRNSKLRRAITDLQDRSLTLNKSTQAHRSEAGRLSEENVVLRQKIAALKDEDLKEVQEELKQTMEHLKKGKTEAQTAAEAFQRRISELRSQSRQLEEQNGKLSEKNSQNLSDVENLQQQLSDLLEESQRREAFTAHEKSKADRVDSLESLEKEAQLQLSAAQEKKVKHNSVRLKSDVRHLQKERDSLKQEVSVLHKQLQNSNEKNQVLEMALHSSGVQSRSRKLFREEMSRLLQQEQTLLKGENQRLQTELRSTKGELRSSRDKVCELDASLLSLEALQQENVCLKQQLETHRFINTGSAAAPSLSDPEALQKENELSGLRWLDCPLR